MTTIGSMSECIYIKFSDTPATPEERKEFRRMSRIMYAIFFFIPKANPEYEHLINDVAEWLLEIDSADNLPIREVAKDSNGKTLFIMPWRRDYGFYTDNTMKLDFFIEHHQAIVIDKTEFDKNWNEFAQLNPEDE